MARRDVRVRVSITFDRNIKKLYPSGSMREKTEELNKVIEEILYGKKNEQKRKPR